MIPKTVDLSVIIPSFNTALLLVECIESIHSRTWRGCIEIIVVDNGSTDGTSDVVARKHPNVQMIKLPDNRGYGAACNAGARKAHGTVLLFLNSDTQVLEGSLNAVLDAFHQFPDLGCASCREISPKGETVPGCLSHHTLRSAISAMTRYAIFRAEGARLRITDWDRKSDRWVENANGFAWAIRREAFEKIGGFDENIFLYFEEQDITLWLQQAGYRNRYLSGARVIHLLSQSSKKISLWKKRQLWLRSFVCLRKKHGLSRSVIMDSVIIYPFLVLWWMRACIREWRLFKLVI